MILTAYVLAVDPAGQGVLLPPGPAPEWAQDAISNPHVWERQAPAGNASLDEWRDYAQAAGFDTDGLTRDQIRNLF